MVRGTGHPPNTQRIWKLQPVLPRKQPLQVSRPSFQTHPFIWHMFTSLCYVSSTILGLRGQFQQLKRPGSWALGHREGPKMAQESANISLSVQGLPFFLPGP